MRAGPFHGVHAAIGGVEAVAEGVGAAACDAAAFVAKTAAAGEGAAVGGVHGHAVFGVGVYAFDDVDFAARGPIGTSHPA